MRALALVLVLVLLAPASGQFATAPDDPGAVHAPVQLVLDQLPQVMDLAIRESTIDGTPHDAEALVAKMRAFFVGFQDRPPWPGESVAAQEEARQSYAVVGAILDVAGEIPTAIGSLSRVEVGCVAWHEGATASEARQWWAQAFGAVSDLDTFRGSLEVLGHQVPASLDARPVDAAVARLDAWLDASVRNTEFCLEELLIDLGLPVPAGGIRSQLIEDDSTRQARIDVTVRPERIHPGGVVVVTGRVVGVRGEEGHLSSPLGLDAVVPLGENGFFSTSYTVPAGAPLGPAPIIAESSGVVGFTNLTVTKADVALRIDAPSEAEPGSRFTVRATASSPLALPADATLSFNGQQGPASGFTLSVLAGPSGTMTLRASYSGDALHAAAAAEVRVDVRAAPVEEGGAYVWELLEKGIWYDPKSAGGWRSQLERPDVPLGGIFALVVVFTGFIVLDLALGGRHKLVPVVPFAPAVDIQQWPRTFLQAFAWFVAWMVRLGIAKSGTTAREAAAHVPGMMPVAKDFEKVRYGGQSMPVAVAEKGRSLIRRLWMRMGGA